MEERIRPNEEVLIENQGVIEPKLDYNLEHRQFLEENNLDLKKVPLPIIKKMGIMNMLISKYKKKPTSSNKNVMIKTDITICDMLQNWKEKDYPDNYIEPKNQETHPAESKTPTVDVSEIEKRIKENLFDGNKIKISVLKSIINKTPNYPHHIVGNLKLRKGFLANFYEIL